MWSMAVGTLHLSPSTFWSLTPLEFNALVVRFTEQRSRSEWGIASLTCLMANIHRDTKAYPKAFELADWLPDGGGIVRPAGYQPGQYTKEDLLRPAKSSQQILDHLRAVTTIWGSHERDHGKMVRTEQMVTMPMASITPTQAEVATAVSVAEQSRIRRLMVATFSDLDFKGGRY